MDRRSKRLESQLCKAVKDGDPRSVQLLLTQGARADVVSSRGVAAIHLAVGKETEKNMRCLKMLLQHGADPNVKSSEGLTPLHIAAVWGCYQNLKLLLTNGGNPHIQDNDGNTPKQLAEQQENRKCAQLLQEYQGDSGDTEDELPRFHYSVLSDQTDISSYSESEFSFNSNSSRISDFGECPLSSTRRSSFFNLYHMNDRPNGRALSHRLSDMDDKRRCSQDWGSWALEGPSILSSTRMSTVGLKGTLPIVQEHVLFTDEERISPSKRETLPELKSRRTSRKSVCFRDVDEYFPVFSPENAKAAPTEGSPQSLSFDPTEYSQFLDSERMATVLNSQGIDVTSPDHVYVFCRESRESTEEELEKTVISHCTLDESDEEEQIEFVNESQGEQRQGSGSTSSHYSSCDSDHYTSALEAPTNYRHSVLQATEKNPETNCDKDSTETKVESGKHKDQPESDVAKPQTDSKSENMERLSDGLDNLALSEVTDCCNVAAEVKTEKVDDFNQDLSFTPSPFVTGRTRSRLSRCSMRTSKTPESLLVTSALFEDTLPTPVRSRRQTPRSQSSENFYNARNTASPATYYATSTTRGDTLPTEYQDTQSSTLTAGSTVSWSQAGTLILSSTMTQPSDETPSDTIMLNSEPENPIEAYERNLAEIAQAIKNKKIDKVDFLTDDLTSTDDAKSDANEVLCKTSQNSVKDDEVWITEDCTSQAESVSSSSSSSYFSPRRSREDSDPPCTPGTGYTPRYSMSRLSGWRRPRSLANISYTPGGRPLIDDVEEPVEYLYTDTEQGHRFIETHIPPTANTSLSSSMSSATSSEETIVYDWRSMHKDVIHSNEKENLEPLNETPKKPKIEYEEVSLFPETKGMTDKELRYKLLELGESPGPISIRTRPTYMKRLCRLLLESKTQTPHQQKHLGHIQPDLGYSPELCRVLRTFELPQSQDDEQALCQQFEQPDQNRKWREGIIKSSFNYLLLDPRVTNNLPFRSHTMTPKECFETFINSIFYVGKGKRSRPYSHLYEALEYYKGEKTSKKLCRKVEHILQVWNAGQGVISLHCFQNVIPVEAYTREACMVEAIGLKMLTNQKRGDYYGVASNWQLKKKKELGIQLLYRAMQIFLAEGERQLRPADIRQ